MIARRLVVSLLWGLLVVRAVVAVGPHGGPEPITNPNPAHRALSAIQVDVHSALRAEASTRRRGPNAAEVLTLVNLYREMAAHPKRHDSAFLKKLGLQVRSRLKNVRDRIERQIARPEKRAENSAHLPGFARPASHVLAQQFGAAGGGQGMPPAAAPPSGVGAIDYGPDLVDVIQQTISPETWDINGGNGSVVYFAGRHALVVSAPSTVHEQVADLLIQLRAAP